MAVSLPIDPFLPRIVELVRRGPGLVLVAEPGAGKTTRVPRALLTEGAAGEGEIIVLEPRRIATRMSALRVAEELGERIGERVGYTVRFEDVGSARTRLRFVTEGILTRRLVADPTLRGVSIVVLDELHERSRDADVALAMLRMLQRSTRPDLRLVAMSATMDADRVAAFLGAEVLSVPGRPYDVSIEHAEAKDERPLETRVAAAVRRSLREEPDGHVLVFLPGAAEIRRASDALASLPGAIVVPLHGDLPPAEQDRAVRPTRERRVILSTNVAETSLTIDGVVCVVDSGLARVARHSPWSGLPTLELAPICQASATQRAGRAGRTRAGRAIRLYTKHDHDARPRHETPELLRADLADTVLALASTGVTDASSFPFFEPPPRAALDVARALLERLGALDEGGAITPLGRRMLTLPLHPRLARLVIAADAHGLGERGALLAALLGEREIRLAARTRLDGRGPARIDDAGSSDALARMDAFDAVELEGLSAGRIRAHELDVGSTLAAARARDQIVRALARGPRTPPEHADLDEEGVLRRSILTGFPDRVGKRRKKGGADIVLAAGGAARLAETSVVRDAELVVCVDAEERRGSVECRVASAIEPEWLLELFPERVRDVREVRFDPSRKRIERVSAVEYDGLSIDESRGDAVGEPGAAEVLAQAALAAGIERFVDADALSQLRMRLAWARRADPSLPDLDSARLAHALTAACEGRRSFDELAGAGVLALLIAELGGSAMARLDDLAPTHVSLPGRKRVPVTYETDRPPWLESRMQDFFGLGDGPSAGGQPIVLHLLAPNKRAVQVTTDLAGFWQRHYPTLRRQLMREYPRHSWPEDPRHAEPPPPRPPRRQ